MKSRKDFATRRSGFTLLELLVVLSILAIVGGGLLVAYDQMDDKASEGVAAHTLASLDSAVRNYISVEGRLPNELDSLIAADYPSSPLTDPVDATNAKTVAILPLKIISKTLAINSLTQNQLDALNNAGITHLRYIDPAGNDPASPDPETGGSVTLTVLDADGNPAEVGPLLNIDIPHRIFEVPRPGSGRNRGRGFAGLLGAGSPVLQWDPDRSTGGGMYDNIKLGAGKDDVLLIFGLGNDASIVGSQAGRAQMSSAPVYGKHFDKFEYGRYLLVVNVGPLDNEFERAAVQAVLNTHGDFVDEMITEYLGQKN